MTTNQLILCLVVVNVALLVRMVFFHHWNKVVYSKAKPYRTLLFVFLQVVVNIVIVMMYLRNPLP